MSYLDCPKRNTVYTRRAVKVDIHVNEIMSRSLPTSRVIITSPASHRTQAPCCQSVLGMWVAILVDNWILADSGLILAFTCHNNKCFASISSTDHVYNRCKNKIR